jgi:putative ABC transport system permease protein
MREFWKRFRVLLQRDRLDRELEEEMQSHLRMQAEEIEAAGMPAEEARYAARRQFGNPAFLKEESRGLWGWRWADALAQDLRFALRLIRRNPAFSAIAILTLGLAIGGNTLVFSLVDAVVLRPLPFADPGRLMMLWTVESESQRAMNSSYPDFRDWQGQSRTFEAMAAFALPSYNLTGAAEPERVDALAATPGLFHLLGIEPAVGRSFTAGEGRVALLSHSLWMRSFGGDAGAVGRAVSLDGSRYIIVGVMPPGFHFPPRRFGGDPEVFVPLVPHHDRTVHELQVIGRLRPAATVQQARAEMTAIAARLARNFPEKLRRQGVSIDPLHERVVADARRTGLVLMGAIGFVLLIACANVANLLLAQGAARRRELAIRIAIGAGRGRLIRQLLVESVLLAALGGAVGVALAYAGLPLLASLVPERTVFFMRVHDSGVHLNLAVLAFTAAVALGAGILFGLLPAFKSTAPARSSSPQFRQGRWRGALVALEISLAFVLLAGAGLMLNSMLRLLATDPGFRTTHLLTAYLALPEHTYGDPKSKSAFFRQALERLEALPEVASAGATTSLPLTRDFSLTRLEIGQNPPVTGRAAVQSISPGYFPAIGTPLVRGRQFTAADTGASARVAIINRSMAQRYWPNQEPLGRSFVLGGAPVAIVGIVADARTYSRQEAPWPELYLPYTQQPAGQMYFVLRTAANPASLAPAMKKEIWRVNPNLPLTDIRTMDALVSTDIAVRRFLLLLVGAFALTALALSGVGVYGVVSYSVRQRTQEIGIRMALGASRRDVILLVLRQTAAWLLAGMAAGIAGALALTRLLSAHLYGVKPTDPGTFALVAVFLAGIALAANALPARRAARIDPLVALRYE